jgi:two-component system sensor histidine kinase BaeS
MKTSLSVRLVLSYLAVTLVGMGAAAVLAWLAVESLYLETQRENLLAQARLVAATVSDQTQMPLPSAGGDSPANPALQYSQLSNVMPGLHTRLIDKQGAVLIDLSGQPQIGGMELPALAQQPGGLVSPGELMARPEIAQALSGQPATAVRQLEALGGKRVLYAAVPVLAQDGSVLQLVYLATPLPDTQWSALPGGVRWQFGLVFLAGVVLALAVGLLLARRISQPIGRLAQAAQAVAAGDLGQSVPEDGQIKELATLGTAFNGMTAYLRQSDQVKTAFISDVTHELRTPLTVIKGTIETLQDGALDDLEARGPFLAAMYRETERLIRMVNDLLILTRADAGALNLQMDILDLEELVRVNCAHFERLASQRQVRLEVALDGPELEYTVQADQDRLTQVLDNLLDNALRYSPPGSQITVHLSREGRWVVCRVADQGSGIPPQHLPFIFERFYRADAGRGRGQGGSGLGLSIVRGLVQAHGGRVSASSQAGQGAVISFWLPAAE